MVKKKHRGGIVATVRSHSRIVTVGRAQRPAALPPVHINPGASEMPMTSKITCRCGRVTLTACGGGSIFLVAGMDWCCGDCVRLPRRVASTTSRVVKPPSAATRARQRVRSAARRPPRRAPRPPSEPPARPQAQCCTPPRSPPEIQRACIKPDHDLTEEFFHQLEQEFSHPTCR